MSNTFKHVPLDDDKARYIEDIRTRAEALENIIKMSQRPGRYRSNAEDALEAAVMWANKGVSRS